MGDRRALVWSLFVPGWTLRRTHRSRAVVLLGVGVLAPLVFVAAALASSRTWVALSLDRSFLGVLVIVVAAFVGSRVTAVWWWLADGAASTARRSVAATAAVLIAIPGLVVGVGVVRARSDIAPVFTPTPGDRPLFDAAAPAVTAPPATAPATTTPAAGPSPTAAPTPIPTSTTLPPLPVRPDSRVDPVRLGGVYTVLLLGGDAGPDRQGLRTDSMILLSVHTPSGRASLISLPRDLRGLLFPPSSALGERYPYGFDRLANGVYSKVSVDPELREAYTLDGIRPGVVALAEAIGYSLDVTIHDYVLIDMEGFVGLIDALGGVTVTVTKQLPMPGNIPNAPGEEYPETIGPGVIEMDGTLALGFVRSRYADSDFQRTARQRELLAALARQVSFGHVVANYQAVTSAIGGTLRTSLTSDELADLFRLIGGETAIVESVGLVPPLISIDEPDFQLMAEVVGEVQLALVGGYPSRY